MIIFIILVIFWFLNLYLGQCISSTDEANTPAASLPKDVCVYTDYLKARYKRNKFSSYMTKPSSSIDLFVKLQLHEVCKNVDQMKISRKLELEQIGLPNEALQCPHNILIEGDSGIGKTTLMWEFSKKWAHGHLQSQGWDIVLLVQLHDNNIRNAKDISDLLHTANSEINKTVPSVSKHILASLGMKVLLILDGYDELSSEHKCEKLFFNSLLSGDILPHAVIVVTCRPTALSSLPKGFKQNIDQHIVVTGFTDDSVIKYITCKFEEVTFILRKLQSHFLSDPFLQSVMHTPLYCSLISTILVKGLIPNNLTELFTSFVNYLLQQNYANDPEYQSQKIDVNNIDHLPPKIRSDILTLAELAADGIENSEYVWDDLTCNTLGLMQTMENTVSGKPECVSYTFRHLIIQEYLAALYWSNVLPRCKLLADDMAIRQYLDSILENDELALVFYFSLADISTDFIKENFFLLKKCHGNLLYKLLFERRDKQLIRNIFDNQNIDCHLLSELDSYCVGYCVTSASPSTKFYIDITSKHFAAFCQASIKEPLEQCGRVLSLKIVFDISNFAECIDKLSCTYWRQDLIECSFYSITGEVSDQLPFLGELLPKLQSLRLFKNDFTILRYLTGMKTLTKLELYHISCNTYNYSPSSPVEIPLLQLLEVGSSDIPLSCLIIPNLRTITDLVLINCITSEEDALRIAEAFGSLSNSSVLKNVEVSCNIFSSIVILGAIIENDCLSDVALHSSFDQDDRCCFDLSFSNSIINNLDNADNSLDQDSAKSSDDDMSYHQSADESSSNESSSVECVEEEEEEEEGNMSDADDIISDTSKMGVSWNHSEDESFCQQNIDIADGNESSSSDNYNMCANITHIDGDGFDSLARGLQRAPVEKLTMIETANVWSDEDFISFCTSLSMSKSLKVLAFIDVDLNTNQISALAQMLKQSRHNVYLTNVTNNLFDALCLSDAVIINDNIPAFTIESGETDNCNWSIEYKKNECYLTPKLKISGDFEEYPQIIPKLIDMLLLEVHTVRTLKFCNIDVSPTLSALSHMLKKNTTLVSLKITRHSCLQVEGAICLASGLRANTSLRFVKILDYSIGIKGAKEISNALSNKENCSLVLPFKFQKYLTKKQQETMHDTFCQNCGEKFKKSELSTLVGCDECTRWYHKTCVDIKDTNEYWKCPECS